MLKIRNFIIIAHIDHGKSTLSDSILKKCGIALSKKQQNPTLDDLKSEKDRGITIKSNCVSLNYKGYLLHLIDSPGHRDFNNEVRVAIQACDSAILLVDARSGVSARTLATLEQARAANLYIVPVINKVDVADQNQIEQCMYELMDLGFELEKILQVSGRTGLGVENLLDCIINDCPAPKQWPDNKLRALVIDCFFDKHIGVRILVRVFSGTIKKGDKLQIKDRSFNAVELKIKTPQFEKIDELQAGQLGNIVTQIKNPRDVAVGDIIFSPGLEINDMVGVTKPKAMVFCVLYSDDPDKADIVKDILEKYALNDAAFSFETEMSKVYGMCFKCGFLGLLHMEIVFERLLHEYNCDLVKAMPNVRYKVYLKNGEMKEICSAYDWLNENLIDYVEEPLADCIITAPAEYLGNLYSIFTSRRAFNIVTEQGESNKMIIKCSIPLSEVIYGLPDKVCEVTSGFGDFEYLESEYVKTNVGKMSVLINEVEVPELATIVHSDFAVQKARKITEKLAENIDREQIDIKIQAVFQGKILSRDTVKRYMSDVTSGCYGGDITRRKKLWENQAKGKKTMQSRYGAAVASRIDIPKLVKEINN